MIETFEQFLSTSSTNIPIVGFIFNIILSAILSLILSWIYTKYGVSLSNRKQFSRNFLLITMTTMLVITIVKSSLALSLGLVGALSIIRFRAAIKEPEELTFIFLAIAIGLGLGANQTGITLLAFIIISAIIVIIRKIPSEFYQNQSLYFTIQSTSSTKLNTETVLKILKKNFNVVNLRRLDESEESTELSFIIELNNYNELNKAKSELQKLDKHINVTFLDNKGFV